MGVLDAGADVIAHSVRDQDVDAAFIATLKKRNVGYIPTLTRDLSVFVYETTPAFFSDPFFLRGIALYRREMDAVQRSGAPGEDAEQTRKPRPSRRRCSRRRNLKLLSDAGVAIAMGTDSGARGPLAGLLRARGARDDGQGRPDADAGARGSDRRRGAGHEARPRGARFSPENGPIFSS